MRQKMKKQLWLLTMSVFLSMNGFAQPGEQGEPISDFEIDANGVLIAYYGAGGHVVIPYGVTEIGDYVFSENGTLTSVVIPNTVNRIGIQAFYATRITSVDIPNSVTSIGYASFSTCLDLCTVKIPQSVTTIGAWAFQNCWSLAFVEVWWNNPNTVNLDWQWDKHIFADVDLSQCVLIIPQGLRAIYKTASVWQNFGTMEERGNIDTSFHSDWLKIEIDGKEVTEKIVEITQDTYIVMTPKKTITSDFNMWEKGNNSGGTTYSEYFNGSSHSYPIPYKKGKIYRISMYTEGEEDIVIWIRCFEEEQPPQNPIPYLYLQKTDGNLLEILFADSEISIQDNLFLVNTPAQQYTFNYDEIDYFSFKLVNKTITSIEKALSPSSVQVFLDNAGILHVSGNKPLGNIAIYGITAQLLKQVTTNETDITINISDFSKGIYLVKTYEKTVKIIK